MLPTRIATEEDVEKVPEACADFYVRDKDGFYLDVEGLEGHPGVLAIVAERDAALAEKHQLQAQLRAFGGATPEDIEELRLAEEGERELELTRQRELDELEATHEKARVVAEERETQLLQQIMDQLKEQTVLAAIRSGGGSATLLKPHVDSRIRVEQGEDGRFRVVALMPDGKTPMVGNSAGDLATPEELIEDLRGDVDLGRAFPAETSTR